MEDMTWNHFLDNMVNNLGIGDFRLEKIMASILVEDDENKIAKNKDIYPPDGYFWAILEFYFTLCT